jgi:DNA-binding MarR family transcriptional regulator
METSDSAIAREKARLVQALLSEMRALSRDADALDEAGAARFGVARSDARGMDVLAERGALTIGELAAAVGLTYPAASALVDRMERAGYVVRRHQAEDRRKVVVQPTEEADRLAARIYSDLIAAMAQFADRFSPSELTLLVQFLSGSRAILRAEADRIRSASKPASEPER